MAPPPAFALGELGARSFNLYSCKATAFKDAEAPLEVPFRKMRPQGHRAEFKLLNLPDFPTLVVFLDYTYVNAQRQRARAGRKELMSMMAPYGRMVGKAALLQKLNTEDPEELFTGRYQNYFRIPKDPRSYPTGAFWESISFPNEVEVGSPARPFQIVVKLTQEDETITEEPRVPIWSKLYRATCTSTTISDREYRARRDLSYEQFREAFAPPALARNAAIFPNLQAEGGLVSIYAATGELLSGPPAATILGLGAAALGLQAARGVIARLARNPVAAAFYAPETASPALELRINPAAAGLRLEELRAFFRSGPAEQRAACDLASHRLLCEELARLDTELAYRSGSAF